MASTLPAERTVYYLPEDKLSPSRVRAFNSCPACFEMEYVLRLPRRTHIALPVGSAVHAGVQHARQAAMHGGYEMKEYRDQVLEAAAQEFDDVVSRIERKDLDLGSTTYQSPGEAKDDAVSFAVQAVERLLPAEIEQGIHAVEARCEYGETLPFFYDAYVDVVLEGEVLTIKDLKTANRNGDPDVWARIQLLGYGLPWHFAGEPIQLQIDQLVKKQPVALLNHFAVDASDAAFKAAYRLILDTAAAISTGLFPARPGYWCRYQHGFEEEG